MSETKKRRRRSFCNHFRSMAEHKACEAGVEYESLKGIPFDARPCFTTNGVPNGGCCDKAAYPTPEEIEAEEKWLAERFANIGKAREAIVKACGGPWKRGNPSVGGKIKCPCCESGTLAYSRAGYNGHIHAACDNAECVRWME